MGTKAATKGRPAGTGGTRRAGTARRGKKAKGFKITPKVLAEVEVRDRAAADLVVFWATTAGTLNRLAADVDRIRQEAKAGGRLARMFEHAYLHDLCTDLAEVACQFAGAGPQLPAYYPDPLRGLAPGRD